MTMRKMIENCLKQAVENREAAGIGVLVKQNGEELCCVLAGYADAETGRPVKRDSIFRLYSQSKPITAAAAMILADRGMLDRQAGVDEYLPNCWA